MSTSLDFRFSGTIRVESTFPGFTAKTLTAAGGTGEDGHASVTFNNILSLTHTVTVTVVSDTADFDVVAALYMRLIQRLLAD